MKAHSRSFAKPRQFTKKQKSHQNRRPSLEALEARRLLASDFQNPHNQFDVNLDNGSSPLDLLIVINRLAEFGSVLPQLAANEAPEFFWDVNADKSVMPGDLLDIINHLTTEAEDDRVGSISIAESEPLQTGSPLGTEYLVNKNATSGFQLTSSVTEAVAANSLGEFVVTYHGDGPGDHAGVFARKYDASGVAVSGQFLVNDWQSRWQGESTATMADDGSFVIGWSGFGQSDWWGVSFRRFDADGDPLTEEISVNETKQGFQHKPSMEILSDGSLLAAWQGPGIGDSTNIFARRFAADGTALSGEFLVNSLTNGNHQNPAVTSTPDGGFAIAWSRKDEEVSEVYLRRFQADGTPVGAEVLVNSITTGTQSNASIGSDASGKLGVVWQGRGSEDNSGIYLQRFGVDGVAAGSPELVNTTTTNTQQHPSLSVRDDGSMVISWSSYWQDGSGWGIFGQEYDATGDKSGEELLVNSTTSGSQRASTVAAFKDGFTVAWNGRGEGDKQGIFAQTFRVDIAPPTLVASLLSDTGASSNDGITFDANLAGVVLDNLAVTSLVVSVDGAGAIPVTFDAGTGEFTYDPNSLADGNHVASFTAEDAAANRTSIDVSFTLDTIAPDQPSFDLDPLFDTGSVGDQITELSKVLLLGQDSFDASFDVVGTALSGQADIANRVILGLLPLEIGPNEVRIVASDIAGNVSAPNDLTLTRVAASPSDRRPTGVSQFSPANGDTLVGLTRETIVRFDRPIDAGTVAPGSFYLIAGGERLDGTIRVSSTNSFATFFSDEPLPAATEVRIVLDGNRIRDEEGELIDADNDGARGGVGIADFSTLPITRIANTNVSGFVFDSANKNQDGSNRPIVGATIRVDAIPDANVVTDENGFFELTDMPAPDFFVHVDGSTATNAPVGFNYPSVGKPFHSVPGQQVQLSANGRPFDIFLPPMANGDVQALSPTQDTQVGFGPAGKDQLEEMFPNIDPAEWDKLQVTFAAGSAIDNQGNPATQAAIIPVDPDRLPAPLPPNLDPTLVISIQAFGAENFDVPAQIQFPNLDGLPLGERPTLYSFDHDRGVFREIGTGIVVDDGQGGTVIQSAPGVGILAPGWHLVSDPLNWGGSVEKAQGSEDTSSEPEVDVRMFTANQKNTIRYTFTPPPGEIAPRGLHQSVLEIKETPRRHVRIEVTHDGLFFDRFYNNDGPNPIISEEFVLEPGDEPLTRSATLRTLDELIEEENFGRPFDEDQLYGAKITVTETVTFSDGSTDETQRILVPLLYVDYSDRNPTDGLLSLPSTVVTGDVTSARRIRHHGTLGLSGAGVFDFEFTGEHPNDFSANGGVEFNPRIVGARRAILNAKVRVNGKDYVSTGGPLLFGEGTAATAIYLDRAAFIAEAMNPARTAMSAADAATAYTEMKAHVQKRADELSDRIGDALVLSDAMTGASPRVNVTWSFADDEFLDKDNDGEIDFSPAAGEVADIDNNGFVDVPGEFIDINGNGMPDAGEFDPGRVAELSVPPNGVLDVPGDFIDYNGNGTLNRENNLGVAALVDFDTVSFVRTLLVFEEGKWKVDESQWGDAQQAYLLDSFINRNDVGSFVIYLDNNLGVNTTRGEVFDLNRNGRVDPLEVIDANENGRVDPGEFVDANNNGMLDVGEFRDLNDNGVLDIGEWSDVDVAQNVERRDIVDMNNDGIVDPGEFFDANGNGMVDVGEFRDLNGNGMLDPNEFIDIDRDGTVDPMDVFDLNGNGIVDPGEFNDANGNGTLDVGEFRDLNGDGKFNDGGQIAHSGIILVGDTILHEAGHSLGLPHSNNMGVGSRDLMHHNNTRLLDWTTATRNLLLAAIDLAPNALTLRVNSLRALVQGYNERGCAPHDPFANDPNPLGEDDDGNFPDCVRARKGDRMGDGQGLPETGPLLALLDAEEAPLFNDVDFGSVPADGSGQNLVSLNVFIDNPGGEDLVVSDISFDDGTQGFSISDFTPGSMVAPYGQLPLTLMFDPTTTGSFADTLLFETNIQTGGSSSTVKLALTGVGLNPDPEFVLAVFMDNNNLGGAQLDSPVVNEEFLIISNSGAGDLIVTPTVTKGNEHFSLGALEGVEQTIAFGDSLQIPVTLDPAALGLLPGSIQLLTNDPNQLMVDQPIVGTGVPNGGISASDFDWGDDYVSVDQGPTSQRLMSNLAGGFEVGLAVESKYEISLFDPISGYIANGQGISGPSGAFRDLTAGLRMRASTATDRDGDGLPDDIERAIGTNINNLDTDGDGVSDFTEILNRTNPLNGLIRPIGIVATVPVRGTPHEIIVEAELNDGGATAYIATGERGLSIVDVSNPELPILQGQLDLVGNNTDVAFDTATGLAYVAAGNSGLHIVDVSDPMAPTRFNTLSLGGMVAEVEIVGSRAFIVSGTTLEIFDLPRQEVVQSLAIPGTGFVSDMAREGNFLYPFVSGSDTLSVFEILGSGDALLRGQTLAATGLGDGPAGVFAGQDIVYIAGGGISTIDVSDPSNPTIISAADQFFTSRDVAVNSRELALVAGDDQGLVGYDITDPTVTDRNVFAIDTPGNASNVTVTGATALVSDADQGVQIVNYLAFDSVGQPPTITISAPPTGADIIEGSSIPITVDATDDVAIQRVDFLVDGQVVASDLVFPFATSISAPLIDSEGDQFRLQTRATDTGGNVAFSDSIVFDLTEDVDPPQIISIDPEDGGSVPPTGVLLSVLFDESISEITVNPNNFEVRDSSGTAIPGGRASWNLGGRHVQTRFDFLSPGDYQFAIDGAAVTDRAGNPLGSTEIVSNFSVGEIISWIGSDGFWDDASNWSTGVVPGPSDDVLIDVPGEITVSHRNSISTIGSLISRENLLITGGNLTVGSMSELDQLELNGGGFIVDANSIIQDLNLVNIFSTLTANATITLTGNSMSSAGRIVGNGQINHSGTFNISGVTFDSPVVFNNTGMVLQTGGWGILEGAVFNNEAVYELQGDDAVFGNSGLDNRAGEINNFATIRKVAGTGDSTFRVPINNTGTVDVQIGNLVMLKGGESRDSSFTVSQGAELHFSGGGIIGVGGIFLLEGSNMFSGQGTVRNLAGAGGGAFVSVPAGSTTTFDLPGSTFIQSGTLDIVGTVVNLGDAIFDGGELVGTGSFINRGDLEVTGFPSQVKEATLDNESVIRQTLAGNYNLSSGGKIINRTGATYDLQSAGGISTNPADSTTQIDNQGLFTKSGGTPSFISVPASHSGQIDVQTTELVIRRDTTYQDATITIQEGAKLHFDGSTQELNGTISVSGDGAFESGGTLNANGALTINMPVGGFEQRNVLNAIGNVFLDGVTVWSTGRINGNVTNRGSLEITGNQFHSLRDAVLNNEGAILQSGSRLDFFSSALNNMAGATYDLATDTIVSIAFGSTLHEFNNAGTFTKNGGSLTSGLAIDFINSGLATFAAGRVDFSRNYVQVAGATDLAGGTLGGFKDFEIQGGNLTGAGDLFGDLIIGGTLTPGGVDQAGTITVDGNYEQTSSGTLNIEIGGTATGESDQLVTGSRASNQTATLDGTLNVAVIGGFTPQLNDTFDILLYDLFTGDHATKNGLEINGTLSFQDLLDTNAQTLTVVQSLTLSETSIEQPNIVTGVTDTEIAPIISAAIDRLISAGLAESDAARLAAVQIDIVDLEGNALAKAGGDRILLDSDAAGWGWFVDPTPNDDNEFSSLDNVDSLFATAGSMAHGRVDLLTVMTHELSHLLGAGHHDDTGHLLSSELTLSSRHQLDADAIDRLFGSKI